MPAAQSFHGGVFAEMSKAGFPDEVVDSIKQSVDCSLEFFGKSVGIGAMYIIMTAAIVLLIGIYVLMNMLSAKKEKVKGIIEQPSFLDGCFASLKIPVPPLISEYRCDILRLARGSFGEKTGNEHSADLVHGALPCAGKRVCRRLR